MLILNQRKKFVPPKNVLDARVDHGTAACETDTLPTELLYPVQRDTRLMSNFVNAMYYRINKNIDQAMLMHCLSRFRLLLFMALILLYFLFIKLYLVNKKTRLEYVVQLR